MEIVEQIVKSRKNLKDILSEEYDTSNLPIYDIEEMDKLYELESTKDNPFKFNGNGKGSACNFTLNHNKIKNHKLHVIYYNFQKQGNTKMMKTTIINRIDELYKNDIFQSTDNIILIINESIKDTIKIINEELNLHLKEINNDKIKNDLGYTQRHFGNVFIFNIKNLQYNILNHQIVPKHTIIRDDKDIQKILEISNCNLDQLPVISKNDPVSKLKLGTNGDIFKIIRKSKTCGEDIYYRVCR
jgi:DNA-directed RNA polymerase subunit H (RpoH/RPB5)